MKSILQYTHYDFTQLSLHLLGVCVVVLVSHTNALCFVTFSSLNSIWQPSKSQLGTPTCKHRFAHKDQIADLKIVKNELYACVTYHIHLIANTTSYVLHCCTP